MEPLGKQERAFGIRVGQNRRELVTTDARNRVGGARRAEGGFSHDA